MRYLRLLAEQCKMSVMSAAMYRLNFCLMFLQSLINSLMAWLCVGFIYGSVESISGWSKGEMLILICTSQIVNQIFRGGVHFNQNRFLNSVSSGGFDRLLLRPMNLTFQINTGYVDISCIISILGPLAVIITQLGFVGTRIDFMGIILYLLFIANGVLVLSSFMLILYSLAFLYIKVDGLNNIYYLTMEIANKPKEMFGREFSFGFLFLIPAIPLANAPASVLLGRSSAPQLLTYLCVGVLFWVMSFVTIKFGLKRYSSASS